MAITFTTGILPVGLVMLVNPKMIVSVPARGAPPRSQTGPSARERDAELDQACGVRTGSDQRQLRSYDPPADLHG